MGVRYEPWPDAVVEGVADVLGDTQTGLTGSEISQLLHRCRVEDLYPTDTKRHRLRDALHARQNRDSAANCVMKFITEAMAPVRYRDSQGTFTLRQDGLNEVLVHIGLRMTDQGKLARGPRAETLTEAARHAGTIRTELRRRGTHAEVLRFCTDELLAQDNFHAVLEACKSLAERLRTMAGATGDGALLVDRTLLPGKSGKARIAINPGLTPAETDEQKGFGNVCKGLFSMFRNPTAHDPRLLRGMPDDELLEAMTTLSFVHRRLDQATVEQ